MQQSKHNPTLMFEFPNKGASRSFFDRCVSDPNVKLAQHPYTKDGSGAKDETRVLVTGLGSLILDLKLQETLTVEAERLGGKFLPRTALVLA